MTRDEILREVEQKMENAVNSLKNRFKTLRTGQASKALVEHIKVDYYGALTPISQMANIAIPEPRLIVIKPWDASTLGAIEKAIMKSDLGLNPSNDGKVIRLNIPPLSEERRQQLKHIIKEEGEKTKIAIRNARRDGNKKVDAGKKENFFTEDDVEDIKEDIQDLTKKYENIVNELVDKKIEEVMK